MRHKLVVVRYPKLRFPYVSEKTQETLTLIFIGIVGILVAAIVAMWADINRLSKIVGW